MSEQPNQGMSPGAPVVGTAAGVTPGAQVSADSDSSAESKKKSAPTTRVFHIVQRVNHPETGALLLDEETIIKGLRHKVITSWAYILHDKDCYTEEEAKKLEGVVAGQPKYPHWHIVGQMSRAERLDTLAKWFSPDPANPMPTQFVAKVKGRSGFLDCVEYLTHEHEKQQELGKYLYSDDDVRANFDFRSALTNREDFESLAGLSVKDRFRVLVADKGWSYRQCYIENKAVALGDKEKLEKLEAEYIQRHFQPFTRVNYYISGDGGYGKGLLSRGIARSMYPDYESDSDIFFEVKGDKVSFEGYKGQPVVIWNDHRAVTLLSRFGREQTFEMLDPHPGSAIAVNVKYGHVVLQNKVNIINSVQGPMEFVDGLAGEYVDKAGVQHRAEDKKQARRRFAGLVLLHPEDYDLMLNRGWLTDSLDDYAEYIEYRGIRGNMQNIHSLLGSDFSRALETEKKMVEPIVRAHNRFLESSAIDEEAVAGLRDLGRFQTAPNRSECILGALRQAQAQTSALESVVPGISERQHLHVLTHTGRPYVIVEPFAVRGYQLPPLPESMAYVPRQSGYTVEHAVISYDPESVEGQPLWETAIADVPLSDCEECAKLRELGEALAQFEAVTDTTADFEEAEIVDEDN